MWWQLSKTGSLRTAKRPHRPVMSLFTPERLEGRVVLTAASNAPVLEADGVISGTIGERNEVDRYGIGVEFGQIFSITVTSVEEIYPWVRVVDASGRSLAEIGEAGGKKFVTKPLQTPSGEIFVEAFTYGGYRTGAYQLDLWIQDEPARLLEAVLILTNHERMSRGLLPLGRDSRLDSAAQSHTDQMVQYNFVGHSGWDGSSVFQRVTREGFPWTTAGENVAAGQRDAAVVVNGWMNSSGHRANILSSAFQEIGLGYGFTDAASNAYPYYWTQVFGTESNSVADTVRPAFSAAAMSANRDQVILTYNEPLSFMTAGASAFQVMVDGVAAAVSSATVSGATVVLSLFTPAVSGQTITVSYTPPSSSDHTLAIQDLTGNDAVSVAAVAVANQGPSLTTGSNGQLFVDGQAVTYAGNPVPAAFFSWTIFEAALIRGRRVLFAQHASGTVHRLLANVDWALIGGLQGVAAAYSIELPRSARGTNFPVTQEPEPLAAELLIPVENSGTALRIDPLGRLYADRVMLTQAGAANLGTTFAAVAGFSPRAVGRQNADSNWRNTLLWQDRISGDLVEWQLDASWIYRGTSRTPTESVAFLEVAYQIDINRDSRIG